jgi:hypothetical protein
VGRASMAVRVLCDDDDGLRMDSKGRTYPACSDGNCRREANSSADTNSHTRCTSIARNASSAGVCARPMSRWNSEKGRLRWLFVLVVRDQNPFLR